MKCNLCHLMITGNKCPLSSNDNPKCCLFVKWNEPTITIENDSIKIEGKAIYNTEKEIRWGTDPIKETEKITATATGDFNKPKELPIQIRESIFNRVSNYLKHKK